MLRLNLKLALRYLSRNKAYSFINIAGLSLGLACAMLIILYTKDELTFDRFHHDLDRLYRVAIDVRFSDGSSMEKMGATSIMHGPRFRATIPEVESFVRLAHTYKDIKIGDEVQSQTVMLVDSNFFSVFNFPLIEGDKRQALVNPNSVVITEDVARRHFGTTDAINRFLLFEDNGEFKTYTVMGVAKAVPQNSSIQFEVVMPLSIPAAMEQSAESWVNIGVNTFVKLYPNSNIENVNSKMQEVFESESREVMDKVHASGFDQSFYHQLQPFANIHLDQEFLANDGLARGSNPMYSYILSSIAAFILFIACINFINLTIARSLKRAKEIGIKKVIGTRRRQLALQFIGESLFISTLAFGGALIMVQLALPWFNEIINKSLSFTYILDLKLIIIFISLLIFTGLLAGSYPAIVLSGFNPVTILYQKFRLGGSGYLQKIFIVFQFSLATFLIISTFVASLQFNYLTNKDLGYDPSNVVKVNLRNRSMQDVRIFSEQLKEFSQILSVAPATNSSNNAKIKGEEVSHFRDEIIDENFIETMKIPILLGRNFSASSPSDAATAVLVNEEFVKMAGWNDPIGKQVNLFLANKTKTVVGVFKNYHFESLSHPIEPQMLELNSSSSKVAFQTMLIRISPNSASQSLDYIEKTFKKLFPMIPYSYQFYDDANESQYAAESKWKKVIFMSAFITIFIACLGLLGLSVLNAERRKKEIGIRKVLGASVTGLAVILTKELVTLILVALLVAIPLASYATDTWLETYPFRTTVDLGVYINAVVLVVLIGVVTVSFQSIRAALSNPVETIRTE